MPSVDGRGHNVIFSRLNRIEAGECFGDEISSVSLEELDALVLVRMVMMSVECFTLMSSA